MHGEHSETRGGADAGDLTPKCVKHRDLVLLDGGMGHLLKQRGLRVDDLPYEAQFLAGTCM
jgi:hypothetical protein